MTTEEKQLLLIALCGYLPYKVKCEVNTHTERLDSIDPFEEAAIFGFQSFDVNEVKPYLRPMSSMTEEEEAEWHDVRHGMLFEEIDWLNRKKFDYRGLTPKGLALEAPEGMYND